MNAANLAKALANLNLLALVATAVIAWLLGQTSLAELFDTATYVGLGMGALGALVFVGSTSGSSASAGIAASAADRPSRMMDALWADRLSGIAIGALLVLGGISWIALAWLVMEWLAGHRG